MKKAIQFGAGNIGRGFIGYLLHNSGYHVVFADVAENIITEINKVGEYTIFVKDTNLEELKVNNISGVISINDEIYPEIEEADIITTSVGPVVLGRIAPTIAEGIRRRFKNGNTNYLNIIACENAVYASHILKEEVYKNLDDSEKEYATKFVGFPNCSVDRIVPPSKNEKLLDVTVEAFYEWNVEKDGFVGEIPNIEGMNLADNLLAYIERKLFTLNTGHAITAYLGVINKIDTIDKSIAVDEIREIVEKAMNESGNGLVKKFSFDAETHKKYIAKILNRFTNPYLNDDVTRVGREPLRKLSPTDRLVKPLLTAVEYGYSVDNLILGIGAALNYYSESDAQSIELRNLIESKGIKGAVKEITKIEDEKLLSDIEAAYLKYKN